MVKTDLLKLQPAEPFICQVSAGAVAGIWSHVGRLSKGHAGGCSYFALTNWPCLYELQVFRLSIYDETQIAPALKEVSQEAGPNVSVGSYPVRLPVCAASLTNVTLNQAETGTHD